MLTLREGLALLRRHRVRASDFEHAIERVLTLGSGGAPFYEGIDGAAAYARGDDPDADISGIEADDETGEITIRLTEPDATFANALALVFAAPVPARDAVSTTSPPTRRPASGRTRSPSPSPAREFVLERSPNFADLDIPDIPTRQHRPDHDADRRQRPRAGPGRARRQARLHAGPAARGADADDPRAGAATATPSTRRRRPTYFFLNQDRPPFDDPLVREAVNRALDRRRWRGLYAGRDASRAAPCSPRACPATTRRSTPIDCPYGDPCEGARPRAAPGR